MRAFRNNNTAFFWAARQQGHHIWKQLLNPTNKALPKSCAKGCSLRARVSWLIPAQITIALSVSALSLSPSLTSPLLTAILLIPPLKCPNPSLLLSSAVRAKGRRTLPHWVQLGFKNVKLFSSTKFQPGQQRGDSVLGAPAHPPDQEVSPIALILLAHSALSLPFSGSAGGLGHLINSKHCCQQFLQPSLTQKPDLENGSQQGGGGQNTPKTADGFTVDEALNFDRHCKNLNLDNWKCFSVFI